MCYKLYKCIHGDVMIFDFSQMCNVLSREPSVLCWEASLIGENSGMKKQWAFGIS